ncbi:hypothetical protein N7492_001476 [Penicillium capsulatum]|uniref:BCS1-like ATPase n=1 Tax=Penicillium capsulatum TaxID=69766 RepID=A0A9W9ISF6_9EURO|nr:hypothetical protein N7492_001476 [Penicillium capsulatum]KAJ6129470.1 hypothetical protein N7512_002250 [Penicillium capsulatum]
MDSNQSNSSSAGGPLAHPDTAMLEALVPGYTFISRFFLSYLHIDLAAYLQYVVALAVFGAALKYIFDYLSRHFMDYFISTAEIRVDDEIFNYFMYWMARQPHMKRTNRFVAGVKTHGYPNHVDSDAEDGDESDTNGVDEPGSGADANSFDEYWAKVVSRDKYKPLRFTPSQGRHIFWYRGRPIMLHRENEKQSMRWVLNNERLYLSCLGRDATIIKTLLSEAQKAFVERDGNRTIIHRGRKYSYNDSFDWVRCMSRSPRPLSTVVLDQKQKDDFVNDIKEYLHPRTRRWYSNRGIPYRRGYLLHGPPGTGKTSLCFAAAGLLGLKLYLLNLNSRSLDEDKLSSLFSELPSRCIVLLEDIDTAGITQSRGKTGDADGTTEKNVLRALQSDDKDGLDDLAALDDSKGDGVTLSGLLNVIDGVAASEGRILVMTTNHADKLDAALLRPGRVDMSIEFGFTREADIEELFTSIYVTMEGDLPRKSGSRQLSRGHSRSSSNGSAVQGDARNDEKKSAIEEEKERELRDLKEHLQSLHARITALSKEFASIVPSGEFTAAEIQGYLLNHKDAPEAAIAGADAWVQNLRERKRAREEKATA